MLDRLPVVIMVAVLAVVLPLTITFMSKPVSDPNTIVLSSVNTLVLNSEVGGESEGELLARARILDAANRRGEPLYVYLQTPGGSVEAGKEIIEGLKGLGRPVHTITAYAASMGFHIAQNLDTRYILDSGVMMAHRASGGVAGSFGGQEPSQMANRYGLMTRQMHIQDEIVVKRTKGKQTMESYLKAFDQELYVTGADAVAQGYADKVVKVKCDRTLDGQNVYASTIENYRIIYEIDKCPINSNPSHVMLQIPTNRGLMTEEKFLQEGGEFGIGCIQAAVTDKKKLCSTDTTLNFDTLPSIRKGFTSNFTKGRSSLGASDL